MSVGCPQYSKRGDFRSPERSPSLDRAVLDLLALLVFAFLLLVGASFFSYSDSFADWIERHKDWRVAEFVSIAALLSFGFAGFAYRRWQDLARKESEHRRAEELFLREGARKEALLRAAAQLNPANGLDEVLHTLCEETARALDVPVVILRLYNKQQDHFACASAFGIPLEIAASLPPLSRETCEKGFAEGSPFAATLNVQNVAHLPAVPLYQNMDLRAMVGVKLMHGDEWIGLMGIATAGESRHFTRDDLTLLKGLSDLAAEAILNARLFQESRQRQERLQALRMIDLSISGSLDLRVTLSVVMDQVIRQLHVDAVDVLLFDPHTQRLEYAEGRGFKTNAITRTRLRLGEGIAGEAGQSMEMRRVEDLQSAGEGFVRSSLIREEGFTGYVASPLVSKGQLKGILEIFHRGPLDCDDEWLHFLEMLSGQAAIAIDNSTMFDDLQLTNIELMLAYDSTLEGWVKALDLRDKETEGHTQRVTLMTIELAYAMGMSDEEMVHIRRGALLHDIGKIGIPDNILLKPGPLDADERARMEQHPGYAYDLLSPIAYLNPALDIPYCHHERWDGTGYPRGLRRHEIPLSARIFAVVDVWDSLRSNRPYRLAWPEEKVLEYIHALSGIHFDPMVVKEFLRLIERRSRQSETETPCSPAADEDRSLLPGAGGNL